MPFQKPSLLRCQLVCVRDITVGTYGHDSAVMSSAGEQKLGWTVASKDVPDDVYTNVEECHEETET